MRKLGSIREQIWARFRNYQRDLLEPKHLGIRLCLLHESTCDQCCDRVVGQCQLAWVMAPMEYTTECDLAYRLSRYGGTVYNTRNAYGPSLLTEARPLL